MKKIKQLGGKAALILGSLCILHFLDFSSIQTPQVVDYPLPPRLAEFSRFIQEIAQQRNDHYPTLDSCDESESFHGISTARTDVLTPESPDKVKSVENSPDKWWFLHERPSPLRVCRELRSRPYFERLDLISTAPHLLSLRFIVSSHCERLHLPSQTAEYVPATRDRASYWSGRGRCCESSKTGKKHGQKQEAETSQRTEAPNVTNRCIEVCDQNIVGIGRSCAKIP